MDINVGQVAGVVRDRLRSGRPSLDDGAEALDETLECPVDPRRPTDGVTLLFLSPAATAVLVHGVGPSLLAAASTGLGALVIAVVAAALLALQCVLGVGAGILALRGSERGIDLTATAMLVALTACTLIFLTGVRLDYVGAASWLLAALLGGMFRLDAPGANAFYGPAGDGGTARA
jgi:hypothetical protein